ncbi:hypothetical protein BpHYR1_044945 [Brachionus plicatilis]|uniref:Uncharacterized protein n=1 Tax=Brachionus plicatilis TaxID=10195 RepID=A0A3M7S0R0_BRAPC|nr:hypothetical protein BpHYR1_044945 [Brachionus plicatilis]
MFYILLVKIYASIHSILWQINETVEPIQAKKLFFSTPLKNRSATPHGFYDKSEIYTHLLAIV